MQSEFLRVAEQVLEQVRQPLSPKEIVELAYKNRMFSDKISGKTPFQTMKSKLSVHIRNHPEDSPFVRTSPGKFYLRRLMGSRAEPAKARPSEPPPLREHVLTFPSDWLDQVGRFQGVSRNWKKIYKTLLNSATCNYMPRLAAESDNDHKQILTYVMITRGNKILAFKRGTYTRVADFLRGSHCIGFGGHVGAPDASLFSTKDLGLVDSAIRELSEEIDLPNEDRIRLSKKEGIEVIGVLNDDSSDVGRRHFAFLLRYKASNSSDWDTPLRAEKAITQLRWIDLSHFSQSLRDFEYWSQLVFREFFSPIVHTQASYLLRKKSQLRPPSVLCVLGGIGSGKSEATKVLTRDFGYSEINSGKVLSKLLRLPPVPTTPRNQFQERAWRFISRSGGTDKLAQAIYDELGAMPGSRLLVDGIRQVRTLEKLRTLLSGRKLAVLFVHTSPDLAFRFYKLRTDQQLPIQEFLKLREAPAEGEMEHLLGLADGVLYNWTGKLSYKKAIHDLMREINVSD